MPNYQNAGNGPRELTDEQKKWLDAARAKQDGQQAQDDIHAKARAMLIIRAMSQPANVGKIFPVTLRPHSRCYLTGDAPQPLGIIFMRWEEKITEIILRQGEPIEREGVARIAHDRSGNEVGLFMAERWMWHQLLAKYKGLSFGNL